MSEVLSIIDPHTLGEITSSNFFKFTKAVFKVCEHPGSIPNYESEGGSCYWYGEDDRGEYVIRKSDHWCQCYAIGTRKIKRFRARIRSCTWDLDTRMTLGELENEMMRSGKCYLTDFRRIEWKTKRRYIIIGS